jgi:hypothetical protein
VTGEGAGHADTTQAAGDLAERLLRSRGGSPGPRLLGIDGRSGTGKTTLASAVVVDLTRRGVTAPCVHMDELYAGWQGLAGAPAALHRQVLTPLRLGGAASYRRWDWARGSYARHPVRVPPAEVVVVEGVGAIQADRAAYDLTVWLSAPTPVRRARALSRDGEMFAPHWDTWAAQEDELFGSAADGMPPWPVDVHLSVTEPDAVTP